MTPRDSLDALEERKKSSTHVMNRTIIPHYLACIFFTIQIELLQLFYVYFALYATLLMDLCFMLVLHFTPDPGR
jgi:hypothetical protein